MHVKQFFGDCVKCLLQRLEVKPEWLDVLPVGSLEHIKHLADVVVVFELTPLSENVAQLCEVQDILLLKSKASELWQFLLFLFLELSEVVQVEVRIHHVTKWSHAFHVDVVHFRVDGLGMLVVFLFPVFQLSHELLAPLKIVVEVQLLNSIS